MKKFINIKTIIYYVSMFLSLFIFLSHAFLHLFFYELAIFSLLGTIFFCFVLSFTLKKWTSAYVGVYTVLAIFVFWMPFFSFSRINERIFDRLNECGDALFDDRNLKPYAVNDEQIIPMNQTRINFDDGSIKGEAFLINDDKTYYYVTKQIVLTIRVNNQEKKYSFKFANIRHMDEFTLQYANGYLYFRSLMDFYVFDLSDENMSYNQYSLDQPTFNKYVVTFEWDNRLFLGSGQILYQYEPTGEVIEVLRLNEDESIVDGFHYQDYRILITYNSEVKKFSIDVYNEHFEKIKNLRNNLIIHPLHYEIGEDLYITSDGNLSQYSNQLTLLSSKYFFLEDLKQEWEYYPPSLHF